MAEEINTLNARQLREAFKNTEERELNEKAVRCDMVWVFGAAVGNNKEQMLSLEKDGKQVASIMITNATLKRLKREYEQWRRIGTSSEGFGSKGDRW